MYFPCWFKDPHFFILQVLDYQSGIEIFLNKTIRFYTTAFVTISCHMQFKNYPMDKQVCHFYIKSAKYTEDQMIFTSSHHFDPDPTQSQDFEITVTDILQQEVRMSYLQFMY